MATFPTFASSLINTAGSHIFVSDSGGDGPAVLCIPGLGDSGKTYRHLAPLLAEAGHRVVVMDLRGHGQSGADFETFTPLDIAADAIAVLDACNIRRAAVIGCSIGGAAAAWLAADTPERVERVVLVNPFVRDVPADAYFRPLSYLMFASPWGAWAWTQYFRTLLPTQPADLDEYVADLRQNLREPGRLTALGKMIRSSKQAVEARLGEVSTDALVLMGGADADFPDPAAEGQLVADSLGGPAQVEVLEGLGHYPHVERPQQTAELVLPFLAGRRIAQAS
jgi:pimeloyl-ACP methyl ester carboxylesterase